MKSFSKIFLIILFFMASVGWIWQGSIARKNKEAVKLYNEGRIDDALSKWRDAQTENPDRRELHYNIGNALHERKKYEEALKEYEKALVAKNDEFKSMSHYNIGNTHYRMGMLEDAIKDYERCLEINPDDEDAKYNIEFIKKKMEEMKKGHQDTGTQEQQRHEKQEQKQEEGAKEEQGSEKEQKDKGEEQEGEMSEEDALRLLDALKDDEKELQRELRVQPFEDRYRVDKDW